MRVNGLLLVASSLWPIPLVRAADVVSVDPDQGITISAGSNQALSLGQALCIYRSEDRLVCGKIISLQTDSARIQLEDLGRTREVQIGMTAWAPEQAPFPIGVPKTQNLKIYPLPKSPESSTKVSYNEAASAKQNSTSAVTAKASPKYANAFVRGAYFVTPSAAVHYPRLVYHAPATASEAPDYTDDSTPILSRNGYALVFGTWLGKTPWLIEAGVQTRIDTRVAHSYLGPPSSNTEVFTHQSANSQALFIDASPWRWQTFGRLELQARIGAQIDWTSIRYEELSHDSVTGIDQLTAAVRSESGFLSARVGVDLLQEIDAWHWGIGITGQAALVRFTQHTHAPGASLDWSRILGTHPGFGWNGALFVGHSL